MQYFDHKFRRAHARCTEIYLSRYRRGGNSEGTILLLRLPLLTSARARASASRSFSPFFPRSRSQILTYDYVGGVSARISPESRGGRRNGFADPRGHGSGNSGDPRSREGGRESRADKREIEVRGGGGRKNPEGNEEDVQEDAVVAED